MFVQQIALVHERGWIVVNTADGSIYNDCKKSTVRLTLRGEKL